MGDHLRYERGSQSTKDSKTVQEDEVRELRALLTKSKAELKEERDKFIELEDYPRRENLKFHNIPESEKEGVNHSPKQVKVFSAFCKRNCKWTLHKFDFTQWIELASEKKTNTDR